MFIIIHYTLILPEMFAGLYELIIRHHKQNVTQKYMISCCKITDQKLFQ